MRKLLVAIFVIVMITTGIFAQGSQEKAKTYNLKFGSIWDDADPSTVVMNKFGEFAEAKTDGAVKVTIYNNSQLGNLNDMLSGMRAGTIEMLHTRISTYGFLEGASMFNVCSAPFLWDNYEELEAFLRSDAAQKWFDDAAAKTGVRVMLAKGDTEARQLSSNKAIHNASNFQGLKIRTAESVVVQSVMKALGAQPIVIPFNDLYLALKQNTVDAQENGFITIKNRSFFEVQDYLMKTDYIRDIAIFCISESIWQSMSADMKAQLVAAASEAAEIGTTMTRSTIDDALEYLKTKMTYVDIDIKSVQDKLGNVYEQLDGQAWAKGAYAEVKAFKDSN